MVSSNSKYNLPFCVEYTSEFFITFQITDQSCIITFPPYVCFPVKTVTLLDCLTFFSLLRLLTPSAVMGTVKIWGNTNISVFTVRDSSQLREVLRNLHGHIDDK